MPKTECCVPMCTNRGGHVFPSDKLMCKTWIISIKRGNDRGGLWVPTATSVVCHSHFPPSDYIGETSYGGIPQVRRLKKTSVPSIFPWNTDSPQSSDRLERSDRRATKRKILHEQMVPADDAEDSALPEIGEECEIEDSIEPGPSIKTSATSCSTQTDFIQTADAATETIKLPKMSVNNFIHDPQGIHCFTGLENYDKFIFVLQTLGPAAAQLKYMYGSIQGNISIEDLFFLVLIKLRKHYSNFELSRLFDISEADVYNIFCTWIRFLSLQWREVPIWVPQELARFYSPTGFKAGKFSSTRVIVDGTECPIKKPKLPTAQQASYSTYKNRNTMKVLVGISPGGLCTYMSPAYGGSTSDRQIVERSNMVQMCDSGDSIMADKGFDVQDIFAPYNVAINIPTFFRKKNRMTGATVLSDRKIASKRVHVERFIGLAKTYKILTVPLHFSESQLSSDIIFVCFMLCNFRSCIVPRHA